MKRNQVITPVLVFVLVLLAVAAAGYAPHSSNWRRASQNTAMYVPCNSTIALRSTDAGPAQVATQSANQPLYPVPSDDVIARGHSGRTN